MERMTVPPARPGSWDDAMYRAGAENRLLLLDVARDHPAFLEERGHRAIGVVYHPHFEHHGNYVPTVLPLRYDAFLFLKETQALHPLHEMKAVTEGDLPETYPSGV